MRSDATKSVSEKDARRHCTADGMMFTEFAKTVADTVPGGIHNCLLEEPHQVILARHPHRLKSSRAAIPGGMPPRRAQVA